MATTATDGAPDADPLATSCFTNDSAMMIAYERALETRRGEDALFQDPFAAALAGPKGETLSSGFEALCGQFELDGWPEFHKTWTAVRTRFLDDAVSEHATTQRFAQLVNLGAGMDTRPYRMEVFSNFANGTFSVDMPVVNTNRDEIFQKVLGNPSAHCAVHTVDLDFLDEKTTLCEALAATSKFDATKPSVFIAEGLVMYLGAKGKFKLIRDVSAAACPESVFVLQFLDASDSKAATDRSSALSAEEARQAFTEHGWEVQKFWKFGEPGLDFDRFPKDKFQPLSAFSFVVAVKSAAVQVLSA